MSTPTHRSIEFRNTALGATLAVLHEIEPARLADDMHKMLGGMPDFFSGEATVLDFAAVKQVPERIDWAGMLSLLRRYQLQPIGVRNLAPALAQTARQAGLAILDTAEIRADASRPVMPAQTPAPAPAPAQTPAPAVIQAGTLFIDRPLRSGQQIYARGGDLVLLAGMSNGAEVIADGSIHCFGPLRGRALAGAQGDTAARIITTHFGPELVSIAGVYRTFEAGIPEKLAARLVQAKLSITAENQTLNIEPLQLD